MPSPVLATSLIRPLTLRFCRSLDFKDKRPKFLYLLHASVGPTLGRHLFRKEFFFFANICFS